jgi:cytochrome c peroxidase
MVDRRFMTLVILLTAILAWVATPGRVASEPELSPEETLGKSIFFDENLSINNNQSCAACHSPEVGWTGPISDINAHGAVYEGSISGRFGNRKPPSAAYATPSPILHFVIEKKEELFIGGNFWDGRATGEKLGNPAADQAQGPFLNPAEQGLPDNACVVYRVCNPVVAEDYPVSFEEVWGTGACSIAWPADIETVCATEGATVSLSAADEAKVEAAYDNIGLSIATYEGSSEVNPFTSKYDYYLAGMVDLTKEEKKGLHMFKGKGKCAKCHIADPDRDGNPPLFTDFTYDNLGVPKNPENPVYGSDPGFVDEGLGGFLWTRGDWNNLADENRGKQKVPTLRNVAKKPSADFVKAYGHNGYFKTLEGIVEFYSTRDLKPECPGPYTEAQALAANCWPEPEVEENVNTSELGRLHLTEAQIKAIVAFLATLSDGYQLPAGP